MLSVYVYTESATSSPACEAQHHPGLCFLFWVSLPMLWEPLIECVWAGVAEGGSFERVLRRRRQGGICFSRKSTELMLVWLCSDSFEINHWWSRDSVCLLKPYSFPHPFMPYLIYRGT